MSKIVILILLCLFIVGCDNTVGGKEIVCPACNSDKANMCTDGNFGPWFHFHCYKCGAKSGNYNTLHEAFKLWKLSPVKGIK